MLVSGLIPEETIANAEAAMWSVLRMDRDASFVVSFARRNRWKHNAKRKVIGIDPTQFVDKQGVIEHFGVQIRQIHCLPHFRSRRAAWLGKMQVHFTVRSHDTRGSPRCISGRKTGIIAMGTSMVDIDLSMRLSDGVNRVSSLTLSRFCRRRVVVLRSGQDRWKLSKAAVQSSDIKCCQILGSYASKVAICPSLH